MNLNSFSKIACFRSAQATGNGRAPAPPLRCQRRAPSLAGVGGGAAAAPAGAKGPLVKKPVLGKRKDVKKPSRGGGGGETGFSSPAGLKFEF